MIKNKLSRPISELRGLDANQPGAVSSGKISFLAQQMKSFFTSANKELDTEQEKYFDILKKEAVQRDIYHKVILLVILQATTKKKFGEQKIKEKTLKKTEREVKKEEKIAEKKAETTKSKTDSKKVEKKVDEKPVAETKVEKKVEAEKPKDTAKKVDTVSSIPPTATPAPPGISGAAKTAVKTAGTGLLTAASMSIRGETGGTSLKSVAGDTKKVGQVVPNDPKPGVSSYGVFGLNSGGSVQNFVKDNPQFNLSQYKPASKEFDDAWKKIANERTQEFFDAQINWYDKYVYQPVKRDMKKVLPVNLSSDDGVLTYIADRRNQMGKLKEDVAIRFATPSKDPKEFISKIAEHDASDEFIRKAFKTYIATHGERNIKGLRQRVLMRKEMSIGASGNMISDISTENRDMKKDMAQTPGGGSVIMQQNNNNTTQTTNVISPKRQDNTNPILR